MGDLVFVLSIYTTSALWMRTRTFAPIDQFLIIELMSIRLRFFLHREYEKLISRIRLGNITGRPAPAGNNCAFYSDEFQGCKPCW